MKIAITVWGNRISPVFDSATTLMIVEIKNSKIVSQTFEAFNPKFLIQIRSIFTTHQIKVLICGAITDVQSKSIEHSGIKLIPFITGNIDDVLACCLKKAHRISDFLMPGAVSDVTFKNIRL